MAETKKFHRMSHLKETPETHGDGQTDMKTSLCWNFLLPFIPPHSSLLPPWDHIPSNLPAHGFYLMFSFCGVPGHNKQERSLSS